jgi:ketosteroid isomerase-like protein
MRVEDLKLTALDDHTVLAAFRIRMLETGSGSEVSMRLWNLLRLEDARIVRLEEFDDETAALAAAGR